MVIQSCSVAREGRITIITIDREQSHNALHTEAHFELEEAFDAFAADDEQWVAIITGAGAKAFCAGNDLKLVPEISRDKTPKTGFGGLSDRHDLNKPVIAAVNGVAMGGGFELALACDIIIAHERAIFALPEPRVGLAALAGGIQRLILDIGLKRALSMLLTGRKVSAAEGKEMGFVAEVVSGDVLEAAKRWAKLILECGPLSVRATKEAVWKELAPLLARQLAEEWDYPGMARLLQSADAAEGPKAFSEKRTPVWLGR
ncbi:enoyl-CoA hydratase-related protein [Rhizorhabdus sp.]|jgi:enoyl-CoA hydratase/carnithine racemase|uniref:enoyl-CoA hydratase-related protein n=1 Tax=Rhizorhabdus sp. TaxID=1968843 RepID=UPI0012280553|nr:enoyl-CoA hydratase-related protein [Rhizorhabdus sp.]MBD3759228.1 enoyl-CoA hydratase/isomerase family protein [Rhizorhabdus sp.]TAK09886.1 MAG: enoyl-CoA hydratase [Rhizorhabdus sp.]